MAQGAAASTSHGNRDGLRAEEDQAVPRLRSAQGVLTDEEFATQTRRILG